MGGGFGGGQQADEFGGHQGGVFHLPLGAAGVDIQAAHRQNGGGGVKVFVFDLAQFAAVHGIGFGGREPLQTEAVGTTPDLLIGGKADRNRAVPDLRVGQQLLAQGHDLRHAGFVIGPQQGGTVGDDQLLPDIFLQHRVIARGKDRSPQRQLAARIGDNGGPDVFPAYRRAGIHVGDQPQRGAFPGQIAVNIAVGVLLHFAQAQGLQLCRQVRAQGPLPLGGGTGGTCFIAGGGKGNIL